MDRDEKGRFIAKNQASLIRERLGKLGGRPKLYDNPDDLLKDAFDYFEWCDDIQKGNYTLMGLRGYRGLYSRSTWDNYKKRSEFLDAILLLENILLTQAEHRLRHGMGFMGGQYFLKCHGGEEWQDVNKTEAKVDMNNIEVVFAGAKNEGKPL